MTHRATLDFLLNDWLDAPALCQRPFHVDHSSDTFASVLDLSEQLAAEQFAPINRLVDTEEPKFDGERVHLPPQTEIALKCYSEAGLMAASKPEAVGGMQLPTIVEMASMSFFYKASVSLAAYPMLTRGNANTIYAHGTATQIEVFAKPNFAGTSFGTMCLSEPQAGSSLSDIRTKAVPDSAADNWANDPLGPRYRLTGNKMWISGGEHEMGTNIVHLVLAKIPDASGQLIPGVRGISLFIVPRKLVSATGQVSDIRNDVSLAGLNHKCGYRGTVNTLLNFGEGKYPIDGQAGAVGYLIGGEGKGLACMFTLMNEARIAVGLGATMLGYAGYEASLEYAKQRPQGRHASPAGKDPSSAQVPIIEHTDVKRMLMAQKAIVEGGLALGLYCARLVDDENTGTKASAQEASQLLELLTPIAKSWPSEWAQEANSLAIQVLGGYGYTRDFPVEQYWRDNRLNMIHEGTHGIQGLDLLGRKVLMNQGASLKLLISRVHATAEQATQIASLKSHAEALQQAWEDISSAAQAAWATGKPEEALANATAYMQGFGHGVLAWMWLEMAIAAERSSHLPVDFRTGKRAACDYFFNYELPKASAWLSVAANRDMTCARASAAIF
jgi:butyryl-CoA dehydrogenase